MRYEPANAKFFETEVKWKSLCAALKLLGCFDHTKTEFEHRTNNDFLKPSFDVFEAYFCNLDDASFQNLNQTSPNVKKTTNDLCGTLNTTTTGDVNQLVDEKLIYVCYIMRFLYDTALDAFDK
jgi:hypothetical protein